MGERDKWLISDDASLLRDCRLDFHKASGKGGQKVNKTSSAARLTHIPSGISASSQESRSQAENRAKALRRLRMEIALRLRESPDAAKAPDLESRPSERNPAYPLWAAGVLDALHAEGWDLKAAATRLGASPSKLAKELYKDPALWQEAGRARAALGLPPLRAPL